MEGTIAAAARRVGLAKVVLGVELLEQLNSDEWGSTFEFRLRNVVDHLGRALSGRSLPLGEQLEFDTFMGFDPSALALWDLRASANGDGEVMVDLLAVTPM